jgi:hypothetical protein
MRALPPAHSQLTSAQSGRRGSNPRHQAWKACALPAELLPQILPSSTSSSTSPPDFSFDFIPRSSFFALRSSLLALQDGGGRIRTFEGISRQIYSLLPLATWVPHPAPSEPPAILEERADGENRTRDRPITNRVLCQLSYVGETDALRELSRIVGRAVTVNARPSIASPPACPRSPRPSRRASCGSHRPRRNPGAPAPRSAP